MAKLKEVRAPILAEGYPLCHFTIEGPVDWPIGHCWLGRDEIDNPEEITCPVCRKAAL